MITITVNTLLVQLILGYVFVSLIRDIINIIYKYFLK